MVYGREIGEQTLNFEASGALLQASLVMRDRETDSWWSIMTNDGIGGPLQGQRLPVLPVGEKVQFGEWKQRHPATLVLSVGGAEHVANNPYDNYLTSEGTFRDLEVSDKRLAAKASVYTFHVAEQAVAVPHAAFYGGAVFEHEAFGARSVLLRRSEDDAFYASSDAWYASAAIVDAAGGDVAELLRRADRGELDPAVGGFDTFWYTWVAVNPDTLLLRR